MNSELTRDPVQVERPRKANECFTDLKWFHPPAMLFDEFWRDGGFALMFGASGVGKSLLAVQLAEAIARGSGIEGFRMTATRRPVLYVDLGLTDAQFTQRYAFVEGNFRAVSRPRVVRYKFSERLDRDRPKIAEDLCEWVRAKVAKFDYRVLVVDSLTELKTTCDGTRETLHVMRELKRIGEELRVAILVLTDADTPRTRSVSELDLGRSRVLCSVADSVFAIGQMADGNRYIVQMRSRNAPIVWNERNAPVCAISRFENGMLGFVFDERFRPRIDERKRRLICQVRALHEIGATYREIASVLDISKTQAARLAKLWMPEMAESEPPVVTGGLPEAIVVDRQCSAAEEGTSVESGGKPSFQTEIGIETREEMRKPAREQGRYVQLGSEVFEGPQPDIALPHGRACAIVGPEPCPFMYDGSEAAEAWFRHLLRLHPGRRNILDDYVKGEAWCRPPGAIPPYDPGDPFAAMELEVDDLGNERYIEERWESGKPKVWYQYAANGHLRRWVNDGWGSSGQPANVNLFGRFVRMTGVTDRRQHRSSIPSVLRRDRGEYGNWLHGMST